MDPGVWSQPDLRFNTEQYAGGKGETAYRRADWWAWVLPVVSLSAVRAEQYDVRGATVKRRAGSK